MNTFELRDVKTTPDIVHEYTDQLKLDHVPIVIDNGSYQCRVGWASEHQPSLVFKNLIAKTRKEKGKKDGGGELQVGNQIVNIETVRFQLKMQFDRNVVTHLEVQEQLLDYSFFHLGINTDGKVDHPVYMTEPYLNLNYCRQSMSELLFECYNVPAVHYCVDNLANYSARYGSASGLVIGIGYHVTHIIPVLEGKCDPWHSRRISVGGYHITNYLHRLLQLKYPAHVNAISISRAEELLQDHSFIAEDYQLELKMWADPNYYDKEVHIVQLPYTQPVAVSQLTLEQQKEKRKELAKRLIEINARKREEKLMEEEDTLQKLIDAREEIEEGNTDEEAILELVEMSSMAQLYKEITTREAKVERMLQKIANAATAEVVDEPRSKPVPQILEPKDREDFDQWLAGIRNQRQELLNKRTARKQRKRDLAQRRTAAAQERMRLISQLARKDKKDDNFGSRDEDWDVYKAINKDGGSSDSEEETERLNELEEVLKHHDPGWDGTGNSETLAPGESHQLHVGVERVRAPEVLFQPGLIGCSEAGIPETIEFILKGFTPQQQNELMSNVFVTGGCASLPGFKARLERELREIRPYQSSFKVSVAENPVLGAWLGVRAIAADLSNTDGLITRAEYEERGGEFLRTHASSNLYFPSPPPVSLPAPITPTLLNP